MGNLDKEWIYTKKRTWAIIELTGELPNPGEAFRATEDGNQYEIAENPYFNAMGNAMGCNRLLQTTKIIIVVGKSHLRILQEPESGDTYALKESIIDMVDNKEIDKENGETPTDGPMLGEIHGIFWENNIMALHVMWCDMENEKEIMKHLAEIEIPEDA